MRGTPNTVDGLVAGSPFTPAEANDLIDLLTSADDDALYELLHLDPPPAATSTNVNVGYTPLLDGVPLVIGNAASRKVTVGPGRFFRSATDNTNLRAIASAVSILPVDVNMPAVAPGGQWGFELLYAQLTYVDPSFPTKGMTVRFYFANSPAYVVFANAPNFATLPANTSTSWNIPLRYVRNVAGDTIQPQKTILDCPPPVTGGIAGNLRRRILAKLSGVDARRAYSSANQDPTKLVTGGSSAYAAGGSSQILTSTIIPAILGWHGGDVVIREIPIPCEVTGGTAGAPVATVVDDTRDWRGANFLSFWFHARAVTNNFFGEDDTTHGTAESRHAPTFASTYASAGTDVYVCAGQSWDSCTPSATLGAGFWAAQIGDDQKNPPMNHTEAIWITGSGAGLIVDPSTGALMFLNKLAGGPSSGAVVWVVLVAFFSNHR